MDSFDEKEQFSKRLTLAAKDAGLNYYGMYSDLARMFKMSPPGIKKWFTAEAIPPPGKIDRLAQFYQVRPEWLRANRGPMREFTGLDSESQSKAILVSKIPVISGEDFRDFMRGQYDGEADRVFVIGPLPPKTYALRLHDNSLGDLATKGMCVVVDAQQQPKPEDVGIVVVAENFIAGHVVKRDQYTLISPNAAFPPVNLGNNPTIAGTVFAVAQRSLKSFSQPPE
jgi:SOS-response transcriptional repressor LexA